MTEFKQRKLKFRAWDKNERLLIRLNNLTCHKAELSKPEHIFLQFTGLHDKHGEEVYEMDILLFDSEKRLVFWNEQSHGWSIAYAMDMTASEPLKADTLKKGIRLCSYFEQATAS
ncbi:MAG TPA: YopX family protein [Cyclobacteriaceae bacterium]|nr:YopX family protein [Cyclobacteriaceae bacterium]